jgi:SNF2 family DNA or RNA helicase
MINTLGSIHPFCFLGTANEFRTRFENPIRRGRDAGGTDNEVKQAQEKLQELNLLVNRCIIRRTQALLTKYLPVKGMDDARSGYLPSFCSTS